MKYFFEGAISHISDTQTFGANFKKREFVVTTEGHSPTPIKFEFHQDDVDELDKYMVGEMVTVAFILKGNEYQGKFYVNLIAIAIGPIENGRVEAETAKTAATMNISASLLNETTNLDDENDDLPF